VKLITNHPSARPGRPVFVDDAGAVVDDRAGLHAAVARLGWSRDDLARETGFTRRTVESWFSTRGVPTEALYVLMSAMTHE
jgi:ribosome-binding protein aMBF1 (putative translation factor)